MKKVFSAIIACLLIIAAASSASDREIDYRSDVFSPPDFLMQTLPGIGFYASFLENYVPDATFLTEESNGFSLIDSSRVYYEGDPCNQFNWFFEGFQIDSALESGTPGILPPMLACGTYKVSCETPLSRSPGRRPPCHRG